MRCTRAAARHFVKHLRNGNRAIEVLSQAGIHHREIVLVECDPVIREIDQRFAPVVDHVIARASLTTQAPTKYLHQRCRPDFEPHLGKKVTVKAYLSGSTLWSAMIID
jgi:hypothetical protein